MSPRRLLLVLMVFAFAVPAYGQARPQAAGQTPIQPPVQVKSVGPAARPEFAVVSVKANKSGTGAMIRLGPGSFVAEDVTLQLLIRVAYKIRDFQVSGGPKWIYSAGFDIEAKTDGLSGADPMLMMLQKLLEDRFGLRFHNGNKEGPVYFLTIANGGIKMQRATCVPFDSDRFLTHPNTPNQKPSNQCNGTTQHNTGLDRILDADGISMTDSIGPIFSRSLTGQLSRTLGRPVIDKTGLTGIFEAHLHWTSDPAVEAQGFPADSGIPPSTDGVVGTLSLRRYRSNLD